jgi:DNA-binding response OmpR family regulator
MRKGNGTYTASRWKRRTFVEATASLLEQIGYRVIPLFDGREAFEIAQREKSDILLLEDVLAEREGRDVCRLIRQESSIAMAPIILLSTRRDEHGIVEGLDAGTDDYVVQPFGHRELLARVCALVRRTTRNGSSRDALQDHGISSCSVKS